MNPKHDFSRQRDFLAGFRAAVQGVQYPYDGNGILGRNGNGFVMRHAIREGDAFRRMRLAGAWVELQFGVELLPNLVVRGEDVIIRPEGAALVAVKPHTHVFTSCVVMEQPAHFEYQGGAVLKTHERRRELLHIQILRNISAPHAECAWLMDQLVLGDA